MATRGHQSRLVSKHAKCKMQKKKTKKNKIIQGGRRPDQRILKRARTFCVYQACICHTCRYQVIKPKPWWKLMLRTYRQQKPHPITKCLWLMEYQRIEEMRFLPTILFSLQQSVHETGEPRRLCVTPEGSKPHLPVQPGLVRSDHGRGCA